MSDIEEVAATYRATEVIAGVHLDWAARGGGQPTTTAVAVALSRAGLLDGASARALRERDEQIAFLRSRRPSSMHYVPWWQVNVLLLVTNLLVVAANAAEGDAAWFNIAASFAFAGLAVRTCRSLRRHEKEMRR